MTISYRSTTIAGVVMEIADIIGWAIYVLLFTGLVWLGMRGSRAPRGLERLDYRR